MTPTLLPWGLLTDRIGERVVLPLGLSTSAIALGCVGIASGFAQLVLLLVAAGALGAERQRRERPGGDALVRPVRARPGTRDPPGDRPSRRRCRRADPATARRQRRPRLGLRRPRRHLPRSRPRRRSAPPRAGGRTCTRSPRTCPVAAASEPGAVADLHGQSADSGGSDRDYELHGSLPQRRTGILDAGRSSRLRRSPGTRREPCGSCWVTSPIGSGVGSCLSATRLSRCRRTLAVVAVYAGSPNGSWSPCSPWRAGSGLSRNGLAFVAAAEIAGLGRAAPRSGFSRRSSESPGSSRRSASRPSSRQRRGGSRSSWRRSSRWPAGP